MDPYNPIMKVSLVPAPSDAEIYGTLGAEAIVSDEAREHVQPAKQYSTQPNISDIEELEVAAENAGSAFGFEVQE